MRGNALDAATTGAKMGLLNASTDPRRAGVASGVS
jgi:hypothetical protein